MSWWLENADARHAEAPRTAPSPAPVILSYAQPRGEDHWFWFAGLEPVPPRGRLNVEIRAARSRGAGRTSMRFAEWTASH